MKRRVVTIKSDEEFIYEFKLVTLNLATNQTTPFESAKQLKNSRNRLLIRNVQKNAENLILARQISSFNKIMDKNATIYLKRSLKEAYLDRFQLNRKMKILKKL
jgi:hypothetical protein